MFLVKGGRTVYFGDIGHNSQTSLDYFEKNGARLGGEAENPTEYMLEIVGARASGKAKQDWHDIWKDFKESVGVQAKLDNIHPEKVHGEVGGGESKQSQQEFAVPSLTQLQYVTALAFHQSATTPSLLTPWIALKRHHSG